MINIKKDNGRKNKPKVIFGLFGAGGFAREVMPFVSHNASMIPIESMVGTHHIYFVDSDTKEVELNGYPIISEKDFFEMDCDERYFNIAIGDSRLRERIAVECASKGAVPMCVQSPHSIIYDRNEIGEGAVICAQTIITSNVKIGTFFHSNIFSYVAHDCVIGNYVTFAPSVHCNGNVHIHDHAYIGTNAVIKQGSKAKPIVIGEGAVVGMGSVVTKDVAPFTTVVGNPARIYNKI